MYLYVFFVYFTTMHKFVSMQFLCFTLTLVFVAITTTHLSLLLYIPQHYKLQLPPKGDFYLPSTLSIPQHYKLDLSPRGHGNCYLFLNITNWTSLPWAMGNCYLFLNTANWTSLPGPRATNIPMKMEAIMLQRLGNCYLFFNTTN